MAKIFRQRAIATLQVSLSRMAMIFVGIFSINVSAEAQIVLLDFFNPSELGEINGVGYDPVSGNLFLHESFNASIHEYSTDGSLAASIPDPGTHGNDSDYEFADVPININGTIVPANTLLVIEGETNPQKLFAIANDTGSILASVNLAEPIGALVGGSFHPTRETFITIDWSSDLIREFDPVSGNQVNSFGFGAGWDAFFADVDVLGADNNLYLVSDSQNTIRVLGETGTFIQDIDVGALGISGMSGIAFDDVNGEAWISSTNGNIYHLGGFEAIPEPATVGLLAFGVFCLAFSRRRMATNS